MVISGFAHVNTSFTWAGLYVHGDCGAEAVYMGQAWLYHVSPFAAACKSIVYMGLHGGSRTHYVKQVYMGQRCLLHVDMFTWRQHAISMQTFFTWSILVAPCRCIWTHLRSASCWDSFSQTLERPGGPVGRRSRARGPFWIAGCSCGCGCGYGCDCSCGCDCGCGCRCGCGCF